MAHRPDVGKIDFVTLFNLGETAPPIPCLRDFSQSGEAKQFSKVQATRGDESIVEIDHQTYFPSQFRDVVHRIRKPQSVPFLEFLDRYRDASLIRVHKDVTDNGEIKHYAIWIDTPALCNQETFQKRFIDYVASLKPTPRLVITPVHEERAGVWANLLSLNFRSASRQQSIFQHLKSLVLTDSSIPENVRLRKQIDRLPADSAILILDDAFVTGKRLTTYQRLLRERQFKGRIHYLVAVARPASLKAWEERSRLLMRVLAEGR